MRLLRQGLMGTTLALGIGGCTGLYVHSERIAFKRAQTIIETIKEPCIDEYSTLSFERYGEKVVMQKGTTLKEHEGAMRFVGTSMDANALFADFRFTTDIRGPFVLMISTNVVMCGTRPPSVRVIRSWGE